MKKLNRVHAALIVSVLCGIFLLARHGSKDAWVISLFVGVSVWVWALLKRNK